MPIRINGISLIGAGKSAASLLNALIKNEFPVSTVISRSADSARSLAHKFNIPHFSNDLAGLPPKDDLVFIAVPDDKLEAIAEEIASKTKSFQNKIFVHLSGACSSELLKSLSIKGAKTASFHIMYTFPSKEPVDFAGAYAAVECEDQNTKEQLFEIARKMKLIPFEIKKEHKGLYHLLGVQASNFLTGLLFTAGKLASKAEIKTGAYELLEPIISATLNNIKTKGAAAAVSGPIDRGDVTTIARHIEVLKNDPGNLNTLAAYLANSLVLLDAVEEKTAGLNKNQQEIKLLLVKTLKSLPF